ncbi:hypothetical protein NLX67_14810 [Domibacillus sp. A3M-37]|uniref:hypothetical protein n=1 Tax=Domibacillus sp. A3M-37 TaxID=2962037 RepID=UPI0020B82F64|nr:hypothetical protein [Domibacillus sp. A3M-37]MCP3763647.1 hypothetical protein [Domibacillus sp. A3M-37]
MIKIANQTQDQRAENLSENLEEMRLTVKEAAADIQGDLAVILEQLDVQEQFNQELVIKLNEQQQYIKDSLNKSSCCPNR